MPVAPTYPGVYIEEVPSGVRTITAVATSVAAFVDFFPRGPLDRAVRIFNQGDFEREFGGLHAQSEAGYGIQQFFANGGSEAWVVRVAGAGAATARTVIMSAPAGGGASLTIDAASPGAWGNALRVRVDFATQDPATQFNLTVTEYASVGGTLRPVATELFRNLTLDSTSSSYVQRVVDEGSRLVRIAAAGNPLPQRNGTLSGDLSTFPAAGDFPIAKPSLKVTIGAEGPQAAVLTAKPANLLEARALLESALRAAKPDSPAFAEATVQAAQNRLLVRAGPTTAPTDRVTFEAMSAPLVPPAAAEDAGTVAALKLNSAGGVEANVQEYPLGYAGSRTAALNTGVAGADGGAPGGTALIGDLNAKTGIHALEEVDTFNLLCIPRAANARGIAGDLTATEAQAVMSVATSYCERRRAFFLMDTPVGIDDPQEIREWLDDNATLRHRNAALYFPRLRIPDPLDNFRLRTIGASGTIAGLCARIDANRGVWKAPAGTEATLRNVAELDDLLSDQENGTLNPLGINCLRSFPVYGNVCWGARTLEGADTQASEWKYVPVRRLALMLEESLFRGTQWVVFEPNDEPLWSQIRLNIGAFMQNLFRQGALKGRSPREAYFVKCDSETTTQNDIDLGVVNIVVGFAPLKPAEFVILRIQQLAGQIES
jgi:uncharacterized protein